MESEQGMCGRFNLVAQTGSLLPPGRDGLTIRDTADYQTALPAQRFLLRKFCRNRREEALTPFGEASMSLLTSAATRTRVHWIDTTQHYA